MQGIIFWTPLVINFVLIFWRAWISLKHIPVYQIKKRLENYVRSPGNNGLERSERLSKRGSMPPAKKDGPHPSAANAPPASEPAGEAGGRVSLVPPGENIETNSLGSVAISLER